jgi:hypothetical protein
VEPPTTVVDKFIYLDLMGIQVEFITKQIKLLPGKRQHIRRIPVVSDYQGSWNEVQGFRS